MHLSQLGPRQWHFDYYAARIHLHDDLAWHDVDVAGVKSCFIICHDVRYPELVRLPAIAGAQMCYFCSHESGLREEYKLSAYQAMPIARATENSIFCVMAHAPADDPSCMAGDQTGCQ
jgi:predicted amidohydrolase